MAQIYHRGPRLIGVVGLYGCSWRKRILGLEGLAVWGLYCIWRVQLVSGYANFFRRSAFLGPCVPYLRFPIAIITFALGTGRDSGYGERVPVQARELVLHPTPPP